MLKIAKTEFYKLKRYSVVWIGVATMLTVVLLTRFMATASDGAVHTLEYFSNSVIWNNFSLIFPATITLIAGYIIERERVDDTLKNILTIPIPFRKLLAGKLIAVGGLAIILAAIEFVFTMIIFFISRFPGFSFAGMILALSFIRGQTESEQSSAETELYRSYQSKEPGASTGICPISCRNRRAYHSQYPVTVI